MMKSIEQKRHEPAGRKGEDNTSPDQAELDSSKIEGEKDKFSWLKLDTDFDHTESDYRSMKDSMHEEFPQIWKDALE